MKVKGYEWDDINQQSIEMVVRNTAFAKRDQSNKIDHRFSVANFRFLRIFEEETKESWEIPHREVSSEYRNQGIASQLLQTIESFLQGRLESTGKEQELVLSVRQADVLIWAIKNGFMPATIKDSERLRRVFAGDEGLTLVSGEGMECRRHYYIFEKDKYYDWDGKPKPEIWWRLGDESFLKTAFTIRLKKTIIQIRSNKFPLFTNYCNIRLFIPIMPPEITVAQMQEIERHAEADFGLTPETLMENAGRTVAAFVLEEMKPKGLVSILAGKGHNGGDGLVAARYLHKAGTAVEIVLVEPDNLRELTQKQLKKTREHGIAEADFPDEETTLIVDCLLGYGANGCPSERISDLIIVANALNVPKLAVDIPTGFEVGTNTWYPPFFARATLLTLALPKINLLKNPYIKTIWLGDIGIPLELYKQMEIKNPPRFTEKPYMKILG